MKPKVILWDLMSGTTRKVIESASDVGALHVGTSKTVGGIGLVEFSSDGSMLAAVSVGRTSELRVYRVSNGELVARSAIPGNGCVLTLRFAGVSRHASGQMRSAMLMTGGTNDMKVWELDTRRAALSFKSASFSKEIPSDVSLLPACIKMATLLQAMTMDRYPNGPEPNICLLSTQKQME